MPPEEDKTQVEAAQESLKMAFGLLMQVAVWTIGVLLLCLFGGQWLDRVLNTGRTFTVILLLASFPATLFIIYRVALSTVAKIKPAARQQPRTKEDYGSRDD
jgi:F0F1-type ATP synthase assembly protein I